MYFAFDLLSVNFAKENGYCPFPKICITEANILQYGSDLNQIMCLVQKYNYDRLFVLI